jgi:hypothetical protein
MNLWKLALEYFGVFFIVFAICFLPLTKLATGAAMTFVGAFFPSSIGGAKGRATGLLPLFLQQRTSLVCLRWSVLGQQTTSATADAMSPLGQKRK